MLLAGRKALVTGASSGIGRASALRLADWTIILTNVSCAESRGEAHDRAMDRMVQVGARPMTSLQYMLELQRDWARAETYELTTGIAKKFGGAYGLGIIYAKSMFGASEGH